MQGDPFGLILNDARPVIWVWCQFGDLDSSEGEIIAATAGPHPEGTVYYAEKDDYPWECDCRPVTELDVGRLKSAGFVSGFSLGRAIPLDGQSESSVERALDSLLMWHDQTSTTFTAGGATQPNSAT